MSPGRKEFGWLKRGLLPAVVCVRSWFPLWMNELVCMGGWVWVGRWVGGYTRVRVIPVRACNVMFPPPQPKYLDNFSIFWNFCKMWNQRIYKTNSGVRMYSLTAFTWRVFLYVLRSYDIAQFLKATLRTQMINFYLSPDRTTLGFCSQRVDISSLPGLSWDRTWTRLRV